MGKQIDIKVANAAFGWVNSSKNIEKMFDRILDFCAKAKPVLQMETTRRQASVRTYSEAACERMDKASDWAREYVRWRNARRAMGQTAGAQAFLSQLDAPAPVHQEGGKRRHRRHCEFPTAKTLRAWTKKFETNKLSLAGDYSRCGRAPKIADPILLAAICGRAMFPDFTICQLSRKMREHRVLSKLPGTAPSTLRSWAARVPKGEWDMLQFGEKAHYQSSHAGGPIPADLPGDLIQIDFGILHQWSADAKTNMLVKPYLLVAMDVRTRANLGAVLTLHCPTIADVLTLLRSMLTATPSRFHQLLCVPKTVQFDNGSVFITAEVRNALRALGIDPLPIELEQPTSNAVVERNFRLIGDEFSSLFVKFVQHRGAWGGTQNVPAVEFDVLQEELDEWIHQYNFSRKHTKHDATPAKVWRDLTAGRQQRLDEVKVKEAMTYTVECLVNKNGAVQPVEKHWFRALETNALVGQWIPIRITPELDYDYVHALIGGNWVKLESIYAKTDVSKKFAVAHKTYKSGLVAIGKAIELMSGMARMPASAKKDALAKPSVKTVKKRPRTTTSRPAGTAADVKLPKLSLL